MAVAVPIDLERRPTACRRWFSGSGGTQLAFAIIGLFLAFGFTAAAVTLALSFSLPALVNPEFAPSDSGLIRWLLLGSGMILLLPAFLVLMPLWELIVEVNELRYWKP